MTQDAFISKGMVTICTIYLEEEIKMKLKIQIFELLSILELDNL